MARASGFSGFSFDSATQIADLEINRARGEAFLERGLLVTARKDALDAALVFPTVGTDTGLTGTASIVVNVTAVGSGLVLDENFDSGATGWTMSGLWHLSAAAGCAPVSASGSNSAYFERDGDCDFDTGQTELGDLISPRVSGIDGNSELSFNYRVNSGACRQLLRSMRPPAPQALYCYAHWFNWGVWMAKELEDKREWDRRGWYPDNRESDRRRLELELQRSKRTGAERRTDERRTDEDRRNVAKKTKTRNKSKE